MKTSISFELKHKIMADIKLLETSTSYAELYNNEGIVLFNENETDLYEECVEWFKVIKTYYTTSYNGARIKKIGCMEGIRPYKVLDNNRVVFSINDVVKLNWKDWFIQEDETAFKFI